MKKELTEHFQKPTILFIHFHFIFLTHPWSAAEIQGTLVQPRLRKEQGNIQR